jgi:hypothetical protein
MFLKLDLNDFTMNALFVENTTGEEFVQTSRYVFEKLQYLVR